MISCPPLVIHIASTSDPNPLECLSELTNHHHLPKQFQNGQYDPNGMRREYLVLHDILDGGKIDEGNLLREMQRMFGPGCCAVLNINSLRGLDTEHGMQEVEDSIWDDYAMDDAIDLWNHDQLAKEKPANSTSNLRGACLSEDDKSNIRRYIANMITGGLLPALERRISNLNISVSNAKKGIRNVMKGFWRKPKDSSVVNALGGSSLHAASSKDISSDATVNSNNSGSDQDHIVRYRYDSIESQVRLLADTLFLMRDYEASLSMYRLVKDDYKHDRATIHYASVQEMMALCTYLLDPYGQRNNARELFTAFETALYSYTRAAEEQRSQFLRQQNQSTNSTALPPRPNHTLSSTRLATRLTLLLSTTRPLTTPRPMQIADLLASSSSHETPLSAAILLEQSASHYYRANMHRKYAFHMLMSGHMFRGAGHDHHAFRCFVAAMHVYGNQARWGELGGHLRSALAAMLFGMGRLGVSLRLYGVLVGGQAGGRVSVRSQHKFLNHFVDICRGTLGDATTGVDVDMHNLQLVQDVLKSTPNSTRTLEIPNMNLPTIHDSSLTISAVEPEASPFLRRLQSANNESDLNQVPNKSNNDLSERTNLTTNSSTTTFGTVSSGSEDVWQHLMCAVQAELKASQPSSQPPSPPSSHTLDPTSQSMQKVIHILDDEKRALEFRNRKSSSPSSTPVVRAKMEPLKVTFTISNPLGVPVHLSKMQLVATMTCAQSKRTSTNEGAIIIDQSHQNQQQDFHYLSSEEPFSIADFTRTSTSDQTWTTPSKSDDPPFFVVTKSLSRMEPQTSESKSLYLCPLVSGNLEILGVRYRLFDEVWVYHPFHVLGPLLQDTREHRSKRVRGESLLLKSKIENEMPILTVSITPTTAPTPPPISAIPTESLSDFSTASTSDSQNGGAVLQGQVTFWKLKLSNVGTAPATSLSLKTNVPWISICHQTDDQHWENRPTSRCLGPSGTLMSLPLNNKMSEGRIDLDSNVLHPGETADVTVRVRTSGGGRQEFYMLFRYELSQDDKPSSSLPTHRWLRKMLSVPVYPSLTLTASLMPSYWKKAEHVLSVEMTNYRSDRQTKLDINLNSICVASRHYRATQLSNQMEQQQKQQQLLNSQSLSIGWQERVTVHYLIVPVDDDQGTLLSTCPLLEGGQQRNDDGEEVTDFVCLEHAHQRFQAALKAHNIEQARLEAEQENEGQPRHVSQIRRDKQTAASTAQPPTTPSSQTSEQQISYHPTSIASICPPRSTESNIHVICSWTALGGANDEIIYGQHHLRDLAVRPQKKSKGCPLTITAKHKSDVSHNFNISPLILDLEITVRNRLVETPIEFEFALEHQQHFEFIGSERFCWTLDGGDEIVVPLQAFISSPGVYNLQSVRLTVLSNNAEEGGVDVPYLFPLQWIVKVHDAAAAAL